MTLHLASGHAGIRALHCERAGALPVHTTRCYCLGARSQAVSDGLIMDLQALALPGCKVSGIRSLYLCLKHDIHKNASGLGHVGLGKEGLSKWQRGSVEAQIGP